MVKITIEKYNELVDEIANQKDTVNNLRSRLSKALNEPPVINRTIINKTPEILAKENRAWGNTLMGVGGAMFVVGIIRRVTAVS